MCASLEARPSYASSSVQRPTLYLSWHNINYYVKAEKTGWMRKYHGPKKILSGVSGEAHPGEVIAILGGSGAGKSTLLNVLAGRVSNASVTGDVKVNGERRHADWKRLIGYVEQDDIMYRMLTVKETLVFAAALRLSQDISHNEKLLMVDKVMLTLGLTHVAETKIGGDGFQRGISGGERKRVSIGIELITDPQLLFLDEPTSGLDAFTAFTVIESITKLASDEKKTIIMTIHQPRPNITRMCSKILLLSGGKTAFFGSVDEALIYFDQLGYPCPVHENPADFFVDTITVDFRTPEQAEESKARLETICTRWSQIEQQAHAHLVMQQPSINQESEKELAADRYRREHMRKPTRPVNMLTEIAYLLQREFRNHYRDHVLVLSEVGQNVIVFLLLSFIFIDLPNNFAGVQNRIGLLYFLPINLAFSILTPIQSTFAVDRAIILRERYSSTYRVSSFFISKFLSLLPLRMAVVFALSFVIYYITGLRTDGFVHFLIFAGFLQLLVLVATAVGLFIAAAVPSVALSGIIGPLILVIFIIFGGNIANSQSITWILRWIQYVSFVFYVYQGLIQNELNNLPLDGGIQGQFYLRLYSLDQVGIMGCAGATIGLTCIFALLGYFAFRVTTRPRMVLV